MPKLVRMRFLKNISLALAATAVVYLMSCNEGPKGAQDTLVSGTIDVSADETYRPVIEDQMRVFDSSFPDAHVNVHYKPESECFKDLLNEKARVILVTKQIDSADLPVYEQKKIVTHSLALAKDAVAIIVNPSSPDSTLSIAQLKGILTGEYKKAYTVVFDNQGSSTLRYINDSLLRGGKLGKNVYAAKGNNEVVDYVAQTPDAIGIIGLSYVSDITHPDTEKFLEKVKVASIYNDKTQKYYQPYQAYIALGTYPLTRNLYYISRESYPGLGTGFVNFLAKDRGQLIFATSRLFPLRLDIVIRDAAINK